MPPWKSLLRTSNGPPGAKAPRGGSYRLILCRAHTTPGGAVSISARHFTPFSSTGICAPVSPLSFIFNIFPSSPLAVNVAPFCLNCHWGPSSSICSSPEVSPVLPSGSESVERSANSSVSPPVSERSSTSRGLMHCIFLCRRRRRGSGLPFFLLILKPNRSSHRSLPLSFWWRIHPSGFPNWWGHLGVRVRCPWNSSFSLLPLLFQLSLYYVMLSLYPHQLVEELCQ